MGCGPVWESKRKTRGIHSSVSRHTKSKGTNWTLLPSILFIHSSPLDMMFNQLGMTTDAVKTTMRG
ncbi:hypothetical protein Hdeb2414_s0010g00351541 [Helianthus debilis subsp. tardiflorus]